MTRLTSTALALALVLVPCLASGEEEGPPEPAAEASTPPSETGAAAEPTTTAEAAPPATPEAEAAPTSAPSTESLVADLGSPAPAERIAAVRALGAAGDPAAVEPLARVLATDAAPEVRGWAARALGELGTTEALQALARAATSDPDERVRRLSAELAGVSPAMAERQPTDLPAQLAPGQLGAPPEPPRPRPAPGYHLRVAGWVTFAAAYGVALLVGTMMMPVDDEELFDFGWKLLLPVVGPGVAAATMDSGDDFVPVAVTLWLWTAIQATGFALVGIGYWQAARARREAPPETPEEDFDGEEYDDEDYGDEELASPRAPSAPRFVVAPSGPGGLLGLSVAGWF